MAFCENCGRPLEGDSAFCTACGASASALRTVPTVYTTEVMPPKGSPYAVISSWSFVGTLLLMSLPIAGFILTIVWASGGAHNHNRRNLARSQLLLMMLSVAVFVLMVVLLAMTGYTLYSIVEMMDL